MRCRQFRNRHVAFVDDLLPMEEMHAMRLHLRVCDACTRSDVAIRRSLMVVRSMPEIEPSADFMERLNARLRDTEIEAPAAPARRWVSARRAIAAAAAIVAVVGVSQRARWPWGHASVADGANARVVVTISPPPVAIADPAVVAMVPTAVPMWSAMLAAGQLSPPLRFASADFIVEGGER